MSWLTNHFLIAMPSLLDPHFERTVTLICRHNDEGALGIVVNRTTDLRLNDIFTQLDLHPTDVPERDMPVHYGGPVQGERGLVLHDAGKDWAATISVGPTLGLTMSKDVLEAISEQRGPPRCLPLLGFAGWESGQLEQEMSQNVWLTTPVDESIIFDVPIEDRWTQAAKLVGVNISTMSSEVGHA